MKYEGLLDYQDRIVKEEIVKNKIRGLFMDTGTGKTFTSLGGVKALGYKKLLVVALAGKVDDWVDDTKEFAAWHQLFNWEDIRALKGKAGDEVLKTDPPTFGVVTSFESSWRMPELLNWVDKDTIIIVDESHKIKSHSSTVTKFLLKLRKNAADALILTATPQNKGYIDFFTQFKFIDIPEWRTLTRRDWLNKFAIEEVKDRGGYPVKEIIGYKNIELLKRTIARNSIQQKRDPNYDLPEDMLIKFKLKSGKKSPYHSIKRDSIYEYKDGEIEMYESSGALYAAMKRAFLGFGGRRGEVIDTQRIDKLAEMLEADGTRWVIFYNFNVELRELKKLMEKMGRQYSEYNGSVKDLTNFKEQDNGVVLVNYGSGATGLNDFVLSNKMVFYSLPRDYITLVQAKGRIDRIGQTQKPIYYYFVTAGTIDAINYKRLRDGKDFDEELFKEIMSWDQTKLRRHSKLD